MNPMTLYAIRHRQSGWFIPNLNGRGSTYLNPRSNCIPRLFRTRGTAKGWLTTYCKGPIERVYDTYTGECTGIDHDSSRARNPEHFELVQFQLEEMKEAF